MMTLYRLSVVCRRDVSVIPIEKVRTVDQEYSLGELRGASRLHAVDIFWRTHAHIRPDMLARDGKPKSMKRLKKREIIVHEIL